MDESTIQQRVLAEVAAERQRQDEQWGVAKHAGRLAADDEGASYLALMAFRERCLQVAAICVAAVERIDRANAN